MPRPRKTRFVTGYPAASGFSPVDFAPTGEVILSVEGFEALRLSDFEHLDQETAAQIMEVSRQTYGRILGEARSIVAEAFVTGKTVRIDGGIFEYRERGRRHRRGKGVNHMPRGDGTGPSGEGPVTGRGRGNCTPDTQRRDTTNTGRGTGRGAGTGKGRGRGGGRQGGGRK
ncbi:MAG: DUF134 domain-containing protein [Thermodesulfobacteriota bacterium]|nr:DUF134 domain-containing protein [Thermodesulfobacteriota bacterium]